VNTLTVEISWFFAHPKNANGAPRRDTSPFNSARGQPRHPPAPALSICHYPLLTLAARTPLPGVSGVCHVCPVTPRPLAGGARPRRRARPQSYVRYSRLSDGSGNSKQSNLQDPVHIDVTVADPGPRSSIRSTTPHAPTFYCCRCESSVLSWAMRCFVCVKRCGFTCKPVVFTMWAPCATMRRASGSSGVCGAASTLCVSCLGPLSTHVQVYLPGYPCMYRLAYRTQPCMRRWVYPLIRMCYSSSPTCYLMRAPPALS
jgi:hypothetical protein